MRASLAALVLAVASTVAPAWAGMVSPRDTLETRVVHRINAVRANHGRRPLRVSSRLTLAAARHAGSMARAGYFSHSLFTPHRTRDWTAFSRWIRWYYPSSGFSSWSAGENLAWGAPRLGARRAVRTWLRSLGHRANLLAPQWRHVGVAAVHVRRPGGLFAAWGDVTIVAADFGRRRG